MARKTPKAKPEKTISIGFLSIFIIIVSFVLLLGYAKSKRHEAPMMPKPTQQMTYPTPSKAMMKLKK